MRRVVKKVVILADINFDLGTKVSYKKYPKLIWWPDVIFSVGKWSFIVFELGIDRMRTLGARGGVP